MILGWSTVAVPGNLPMAVRTTSQHLWTFLQVPSSTGRTYMDICMLQLRNALSASIAVSLSGLPGSVLEAS